MHQSKNIALVTGASSGLGRQFVLTIAKKYANLEEIWVLARRQERLQELAEQISTPKIRCLPMDLADREAFVHLAKVLQEEKPNVKMLINNAGYEKTDFFEAMSTSNITSTIDVNITGLTLLQQAVLPYMQRGSFAILTCSASSFAPIVGQAVYSASKKYVYYLGRALREELQPRGINVLVLCCGMMNTEMNPQSSAHQVSAFLPFLDLEVLTENALAKAEQGCGVYTMGMTYKLLRVIGKLLPTSIIMKITKRYFP